MKKRLLTMIFAFAALASWAQTVEAPTFTFDGDNLVMTTGTATASVFYGIADLTDLQDATITATTNSLIQCNTYYDQPVEVKHNVVIKAVALAENGGTTISSDTTTLVYGYTSWVTLQTAVTRGDEVYSRANGDTRVDASLLSQLQWAVDEGKMISGDRVNIPFQEADHFAEEINMACDQIEAIIGTDEPYAVLSNGNTVLTFYYDDQMTARNGMSAVYASEADRGWNDVTASITSVVFDASFAGCTTLTNLVGLFAGCENLTAISGIEYLKTDNVTDMSSMFANCKSLTSIDLSNFNTANVTNMYSMFYYCSALTSLDLSSFNTTNVTNMHSMFQRCSALTSINVGSFDTRNVEDMTSMFDYCISLTSLDVSNFNNESLKTMAYMFVNCQNLTNINLNGFNTSSVTDMTGAFSVCSSLISLDLSSFNTENVTSMNEMFYNCSSLQSVNLYSFNTQNVKDINIMFFGCSSLWTLDLSNFNLPQLETMWRTFFGCENLKTLDLRGFNTTNLSNSEDAFMYCSSLAAIQAGNANIPAIEYNKINNPNLLVYVNNATLVPGGVQNVVINGTAPEIILTDVESGNNNWYCPQPFTAQKILYTRNFQQQTQIGVSRGWETIALPFDVQTIAAEDSRIITPFGDYTSPYNFWLRRLTHNGLQSAQQIEANTPYLISMPNSTEYPEEYKLAGKVTFSAENASVPESNLVIDESSDIFFSPTYERMEAQQYIYAINVGEERGGHPEGSVFEQNYREVRPFEAYTKHLTGPSRFITLDDLDEGFATSIEELKNGRIEELKDGKIEELKSKQWYDLNGRRVLRPSKGLYINNGRKVMMK